MHSPLTSTKLFCTWYFLPTHHKYLKHANAFIGVDKYWLSSLPGQTRLRVFPDSLPQLSGCRHRTTAPAAWECQQGEDSPHQIPIASGRGYRSRKENQHCFPRLSKGVGCSLQETQASPGRVFWYGVFLSPKL